MEWLLAAALGCVGGMISGMLGVGGGILFVPALAIFLDEPQIRAEATSLVAIVPVAAAGTWRQVRYGNVRLADGLLLGALAVPGIVLGVWLANQLSQRTLELAYAALILLVAAQMLRRGLNREDRARPSNGDHHEAEAGGPTRRG